MLNVPPSNSWVIFIVFISSCTTAIATLFVPGRVLKVLLFASFLSCYCNHGPLTRVEFRILILCKASPVARSLAGCLKKMPVFSPSGHTRMTLGDIFFFFPPSKRARTWAGVGPPPRRCPDSLVCRKPARGTSFTRWDTTALSEPSACFSGICSFSWANQDHPKQTDLFGFLDLLLFVFPPLSLAVQLSHIHFLNNLRFRSI